MNTRATPNLAQRIGIPAVAACATLPGLLGWHTSIAAPAAYLTLLLFPGLLIYRALGRGRHIGEDCLSALVISPVVITAIGILLLLAGLSPEAAGQALLFGAAACGLVALRFPPGASPAPRRVNWLIMALTIGIFCILAGWLPLRYESWRYWSDAWFHGAVVQQIEAYGIPPKDPYFLGLDLQYMWAYHALVLLVSKATHIDAMRVMPLLNLNALAGFIASTHLLSVLFRKRFLHGWLAAVTAVLAMNALIWLFLPANFIRSFVGDVRGWDEVARTFSLGGFDRDTVWTFLRVYYNQTFLLNKFVVSTAFSLGLCCMAAFWYATLSHVNDGRRGPIVLGTFAALGMLLFHSLVGFVTIAGTLGGLAALFVCRRALGDFSMRRVITVATVAIGALVAASPYLYAVMHLKASEQLFPIGLSFAKTGGILISCALVILLAPFQVRRLARERSMAAWLLLAGTAAVFIITNVIHLPGPNTYDKLPFFPYYPLAVMASWTLADRLARRHAVARYRARVIVVVCLFLLPVNAFSIAAYVHTPRHPAMSADDRALSEWVGGHTPRNAVVFENDNRVLLVLAGPRRYYWGRQSYADQWGYPREIMAKRRHVRDNLYSGAPLDSATLRALSDIDDVVYVVVRADETTALKRLRAYASVFSIVYTNETYSVFEVDRSACRELARRLTRHGG